MSSLSTSITLLQRVKQVADTAAWERFVELYTPLLYRWTQLAGLSDHDAKDVVQDVFVVLIRELPAFEYDASQGRFRGWLRTVTLHRCQERLRQRIRTGPGGPDHFEQELVDDKAGEAFWETEYRQMLVQRAYELMRSDFEPTTWQACWEHTVNGRSAADVAAELGMTENAVYLAKFRVMRRLRQELQGLLD